MTFSSIIDSLYENMYESKSSRNVGKELLQRAITSGQKTPFHHQNIDLKTISDVCLKLKTFKYCDITTFYRFIGLLCINECLDPHFFEKEVYSLICDSLMNEKNIIEASMASIIIALGCLMLNTTETFENECLSLLLNSFSFYIRKQNPEKFRSIIEIILTTLTVFISENTVQEFQSFCTDLVDRINEHPFLQSSAFSMLLTVGFSVVAFDINNSEILEFFFGDIYNIALEADNEVKIVANDLKYFIDHVLSQGNIQNYEYSKNIGRFMFSDPVSQVRMLLLTSIIPQKNLVNYFYKDAPIFETFTFDFDEKLKPSDIEDEYERAQTFGDKSAKVKNQTLSRKKQRFNKQSQSIV
eukprot:TRINITY_DN9914_c0_g1_i1.p1 TRINITY_DN9914_c0_g1~~TRINITY_DN9914_c0_g1_i1.p1  ORF type:complete len:355 (+),score=85.00 TRINITY_DN9914_c0_g1_i1:51-1115(+)